MQSRTKKKKKKKTCAKDQAHAHPCELLQVASLSAAQIKHAVSALDVLQACAFKKTHNRILLSTYQVQQHTLDPVVEIAHLQDGRLVSRLDRPLSTRR